MADNEVDWRGCGRRCRWLRHQLGEGRRKELRGELGEAGNGRVNGGVRGRNGGWRGRWMGGGKRGVVQPEVVIRVDSQMLLEVARDQCSSSGSRWCRGEGKAEEPGAEGGGDCL